MKYILTAGILVALVLQTATAVETAASPSTPTMNAPATQPASGGELAALEKQLLGTWYGSPCEGDYTFNSDGTFVLENFTPGRNTLTGTWSLRWDALPPTLVLTCKTSDFKEKDPTRPDEFLGRVLEIKLLELNRVAFVCRWPGNSEVMRYDRVDRRQEGAR